MPATAPPAPDVPAAAEQTDFVYHAFVSYADEDQDWCFEDLITPLRAQGIKIIHKEDYVPTQTWGEAEDKAIKQSRYCLAFLTEAWVASRWAVFIADRVQQDQTFRLIPVKTEACNPPARIAALVSLDLTDPAKWAIGLNRLVEQLLGRPAEGVIVTQGLKALSRLARRFKVVREAVARYEWVFDPAARRIDRIVELKHIHDAFQDAEGTFKRVDGHLASAGGSGGPPPADLWDDLEADVEILAGQLDTLLDTARATRLPEYEIDWSAKLERVRREFGEALQSQDPRALSLPLRRLQSVLGSEPVQINGRIVDGVKVLKLAEVADGLRAVRNTLSGYSMREDAREWYTRFSESVEAVYRMARQLDALVANHNWFQGIDDTLRPLAGERRPAPEDIADLWVDVTSPVSQLDPSAGARVPGLQALADQIGAALAARPGDPPSVRHLHQQFNAFRTELETAFNRTDVDLRDLCSELRTVGPDLRNLLREIHND